MSEANINGVHVTYSALARRWEIALAGRAGTTVLFDMSVAGRRIDGVVVGRDGRGDVVEMVIDADPGLDRPSEAALQACGGFFGRQVVDLITSLRPDVDAEIQLQVSTRDGHVPAVRGIAALADEPGIAQVVDGVALVPTPIGELSIRRGPGELTVGTPPVPPDTWVRISDAATGDLLAMGLVEPGHGGATLAFGMDTDMTDIHVVITSDPLAPVGGREDRRAAWVDDLLTEAIGDVVARPRVARDRAERAARIAEAIGDRERADRATALVAAADAAQSRRRRRWWVIGALAAVAAVAGIISASTGGVERSRVPAEGTTTSSPISSPTVPSSATTVDEVTNSTVTTGTVTTATIPAAAGRSTYVLAPEASVGAAVVGSATVRAGGTVDLSVQLTLLVPHVYGGATASDARANCRSSDGMRVTPELVGGDIVFRPVTYDLFLTGGDPVVTRALGPFTDDVTVATQMVDPGNCEGDAGRVGGEWIVTAESVFLREPRTVSIAIPEDLDPGPWRIDLGTAAGVAVTETPLIVTIED